MDKGPTKIDPKALGCPARSRYGEKRKLPVFAIPQCEIQALDIRAIHASIVCGDEFVTASFSRV